MIQTSTTNTTVVPSGDEHVLVQTTTSTAAISTTEGNAVEVSSPVSPTNLAPSSDTVANIGADTPSKTVVTVSEDGVVNLSTVFQPAVEIITQESPVVQLIIVQSPTVDLSTNSVVVELTTVTSPIVELISSPDQTVEIGVTQVVATLVETAAEQGPAGPEGRPGQPGPPGNAVSYIAGTSISAYKIVSVGADGKLTVASALSMASLSTVVGVLIGSASSGQLIVPLKEGIVDNPDWNFTPGQRVYLGDNGELVQTPLDGASFTQSIGVMLSPNKLLLSIETPVTNLNGGANLGDNAAIYSSYSVSTTTSSVTIDAFSALQYRSAKYQMQISDDVNFETLEVHVIHDGVHVHMTAYGNVFTSLVPLGAFDAVITTNVISILYTANAATNKTIKFVRTTITV